MFEGTIPDYLRELFAIEKKSSLKKFCKNTTITQSDLISLIFNSRTIGYSHARKHHEFVPKHLPPTDNELGALGRATAGQSSTGDAAKVVNKISQIFKERRLLSAHVFFNDIKKWHLFYFDLNDMDERKNHWKHGAHIHFVNYLWPNLDINNLCGLFDEVNKSPLCKPTYSVQRSRSNTGELIYGICSWVFWGVGGTTGLVAVEIAASAFGLLAMTKAGFGAFAGMTRGQRDVVIRLCKIGWGG